MRSRRLGFSLLESVIALGVLSAGAAVTLELSSVQTRANRDMRGKLDGSALALRLAAQISGARFVSPAPSDRDPNLAPGRYDVSGPRRTGTRVTDFGLFHADGGPAPSYESAAFHVMYEVADCSACGTLGGIEVLITVAAAGPSGSLLRPVQIALRRESNKSILEGSNPRGW